MTEEKAQYGTDKMLTATRDLGELRLSIYEDGVFTDDNGRSVPFKAGIKLSKGKYGIKVKAHELAALFQCMRADKEVREALEQRLKLEKQSINSANL